MLDSNGRYANVRKLYGIVNDNLQSIGTNDYSQTNAFAFYDVCYSENGGVWKLYQAKDKTYILTVSDDTGIIAEVHYQIIDENNGTVETSLFYFKPKRRTLNLRFSNLNIFELKQKRLEFLKVINEKVTGENIKIIDLAFDIAEDNSVNGTVIFDCPAHWLPHADNVLLRASFEFDEKQKEEK